jgi:hypothetical protein
LVKQFFLRSLQRLCIDRNWKGINIYQNEVFRLLTLNKVWKIVILQTQITDNQLWLGTKKRFYTVDLDKL